MVSFSIQIIKRPRSEWTNVLRFMEDGNTRLAVWIKTISWSHAVFIYVCSTVSISGDVPVGKNFCRHFEALLWEKYDITIKQWLEDVVYWYQVIVPGTKKFEYFTRFVNNRPATFYNVKCYTSDPWSSPFSSELGIVSNLKIENQGDLLL